MNGFPQPIQPPTAPVAGPIFTTEPLDRVDPLAAITREHIDREVRRINHAIAAHLDAHAERVIVSHLRARGYTVIPPQTAEDH